jgi:elongation factor Ts
LKISTETIKDLREKSGAGVMECRNILMETEGNIDKALEILKERSIAKAAKKVNRVATSGLVEAYIHTGGTLGALVELNCETDFVARTSEFKELAHHLAMQVAAIDPKYITSEEIPAGTEVDKEMACLMLQRDIKDPTKCIQDIINETIAKVGENIKVHRFVRFELGVWE